MLRHTSSLLRSLPPSHLRSFSLSLAPKANPPQDLGQPPPPRWIRRQHLSKTQATRSHVARPPPAKAKAKTKEPPRFRSRHLSSQDANHRAPSKEGLILLEPHVLSQRLKKLCERGKLDDAVSLLKNSPLDAQNTPVWNTLIWETLKARRYKLAYSLYTDVRPTILVLVRSTHENCL
jgi:hypothetical protein